MGSMIVRFWLNRDYVEEKRTGVLIGSAGSRIFCLYESWKHRICNKAGADSFFHSPPRGELAVPGTGTRGFSLAY